MVPYDWQWRQYITVLCDNMKAASETTKLVVVDVEAGPSRFACRSGFSREGRTFPFSVVIRSLRSPRHKVLFLSQSSFRIIHCHWGHRLDSRCPHPHVQLARHVERTNQIRPGADGCRFRKPGGLPRNFNLRSLEEEICPCSPLNQQHQFQSRVHAFVRLTGPSVTEILWATSYSMVISKEAAHQPQNMLMDMDPS